MIKNQFLLILIVMMCATITSNIGASVYASAMIITNLGIGIFAIGIGYIVGKVIFYITTKNIIDEQSKKMSLGTLKYTSIFGAFISGLGVVIGDLLYNAYAFTIDGSEYEEVIDYLLIFIAPFKLMFLEPMMLFESSFYTVASYFIAIFSENFIYGIMSMIFLIYAMYWGYIYSFGFTVEEEELEKSEIEYL